MTVLRWNPERARIAWLSDVHLGIEDTAALNVLIEVFESAGVDHVVLGGDIADLHAISEHAKDIERILAAGTLLEEIEPGRWLYDWALTRGADRSVLIEGNHEYRLARLIARHAPALHGSVDIKSTLKLPSALRVLPQGGQVRVGPLVMEHLDAVWPKGTIPGGKYPAHRLLELFPDQSTLGGHVHRASLAFRSYVDERGVEKVRGAWTMPHVSLRHKHAYAGRNANWQQGGGIIDVTRVNGQPRFDVQHVIIHRDRWDRPYAIHHGRVHR